MTHYGLNPSFVYASPLQLFADLARRGRRFEVLDAQGRPTGEASPLDSTGAPSLDGRRHGVRCAEAWYTGPLPDGARRMPSGLVIEEWPGRGFTRPCGPLIPHEPSLAALTALRPAVLRTLDWQMTNKRPDWTRPRVRPTDFLQGTDAGMAVEIQAGIANQLGCSLWWCAPPRYELPVDEYEVRLEEYLTAIKRTAQRPVIMEYGNELWNAGFPVHGWLKAAVPVVAGQSSSVPTTWHQVAAREIATLKHVADRVFGTPGPLGARAYYLFVGGQLTVPSHLQRILQALADLGITPDAAGPALYVGPMKAQRQEWEATGAVPAQDELRASCMARLEEIQTGPSSASTDGDLEAHRWIVRNQYDVPYFACYEAGQSLLAGAHPWRRAAIEAQRTEWMGELYRGIRRAAEVAGVDLLNWYSAATDQSPVDPRVDVFGLLESDDVTKMLPKAKAARGD